MRNSGLTNKQMEQLLTRLGKENQLEAMRAYLALKVQQRRN